MPTSFESMTNEVPEPEREVESMAVVSHDEPILCAYLSCVLVVSR